MKIKATLLVFILSLSISALAQNTKATETNEKTESSEKSIEGKETTNNKENSDKTNKDNESTRESWKITDIKNPFNPQTTNEFKTEIEGTGTITLKNGIEILKPVAGYQLHQLKLSNKSIAHYYLAPDGFNPSEDEKHLTQVKKTKDFIIYIWCPCEAGKENCPCKKEKVVKIISKSKN